MSQDRQIDTKSTKMERRIVSNLRKNKIYEYNCTTISDINLSSEIVPWWRSALVTIDFNMLLFDIFLNQKTLLLFSYFFVCCSVGFTLETIYNILHE